MDTLGDDLVETLGDDPADIPGGFPVVDPVENPGTDLWENQEETPVEDPETGLALKIGGVRMTGRGPVPETGTPPALKEAADAVAASRIIELDKQSN